MKKLELNQMENLQGGECTKSATKVLLATAAITMAVATGGLFAIAIAGASWWFTMDSALTTCEEF